MKKFAIVIIIFLIILSGANNEKEFSLLDYFSGEYTVYTSTDSSGNGLNLGFCYMNTKPITKDIIGESMVIENFEIGSALNVLSAKVIKTEYLDDGTTVIYAFSKMIDDKVEVMGKNVNLQIATQDERTVIGWPLILGSF